MEVKKLEVWRKFNRLTQSELAKRAGVNQGIISKIESGQRDSCRIATADKIAAALGVDTLQVEDFVHLFEPKKDLPVTVISGTGRHSTEAGVAASAPASK